MTAMLRRADDPSAGSRTGDVDPRRIRVEAIGSARLLLGVDGTGTLGPDAHRHWHGARPTIGRADLLALLDAVALTGRGGAAFPLGDKIRALRAGPATVVVNGAEGEPGSAKDSVLLGRTPQLVLDGALTVADAIGAQRVIVVVTGAVVERLVGAAVLARRDADRFEVRRLPARFVAGEARTIVRVLNGGPQLPPGRRVHATERGVDDTPTLLANVETFAHVAVLVRGGARGFNAAGGRSDRAEPGTTLLSVSGAVDRPGVFEVPLGISLGELAGHVGALVCPMVVIGGYHGAWLPADPSLVLSRAGLRAVGGTLGAGAVMFVGADTCPSAELGRVADWLAGESVRQCGPCSFALPAIADGVRTLRASDRDAGVTRRRLRQLPGRGACAHPDGAARFVSSGLAAVADDLHTHQARGRCGRPDRGYLATARESAFTPRERS